MSEFRKIIFYYYSYINIVHNTVLQHPILHYTTTVIVMLLLYYYSTIYSCYFQDKQICLCSLQVTGDGPCNGYHNMHTLQRTAIMLGRHTLLHTVFYFSFIRDLIYLTTSKTEFLRLVLKGKNNLLVIIEINIPALMVLFS